jgi:hypothetical protein
MKPDIQALLDRHKKKFADNVIYASEIENIIDEMVLELDFGKMEIKRIVDSEFKMLRHVMSNEGLVKEDSKLEDFKSLRLIRLGSFKPSENKFKYIKEFLKKESEKKNDKKD